MTPDPGTPLTAEEEAFYRGIVRDRDPETDAEPDYWALRLLATLDAARASQAAPVASGALDVERLARAMVNIRPYGGNPDAWALVAARRVAAEYARLAAHPDTAGEPGELDETGHRPYCPAGFVRPEPCTCGAATEPPGPLPDGGMRE